MMILFIILILMLRATKQQSCMQLKEIVQLRKTFSTDTTQKKSIAIQPSSGELSMTFYFQADFNDLTNHMTILSLKDKNNL